MSRAGAVSRDDRCVSDLVLWSCPIVLGLKYRAEQSRPRSADQSMTPKSGDQFSEEIMLTQSLDLDPIQSERIKVKHPASGRMGPRQPASLKAK
jgi:hypothetical protein